MTQKQLDPQQIDAQHAEGMTWRELGKRVGVPPDTLRIWVYRWRRTKAASPSPPTDPCPAPPPVAPSPAPLPTLDEYIALAQSAQAALDKLDPLLLSASVNVPTNAPIAIVFASCIHLGSRFVKHAEFRDYLEKLLQFPNLYWVLLGDDIEGFVGFFDRAATQEQALPHPLMQRHFLSLVLDKLVSAGRLLAGYAGQHGAQWGRRNAGVDPVKQLYLERSIPYFDGQGVLTLTVGQQTYTVYGAHRLPGNSIYNKNHPQKRARLYRAPNADVVVAGDKHTFAVQHEIDDNFTEPRSRFYVQVGTAKTGPDAYTIQTWSPGVWQWPILVFRADEHRIAEAADFDMAALMLRNWGK